MLNFILKWKSDFSVSFIQVINVEIKVAVSAWIISYSSEEFHYSFASYCQVVQDSDAGNYIVHWQKTC